MATGLLKNYLASLFVLTLIVFGMLAVFFVINSFIKEKNINLEIELEILLIIFISTGVLSYFFPHASTFLVIMEFLFLYKLEK